MHTEKMHKHAAYIVPYPVVGCGEVVTNTVPLASQWQLQSINPNGACIKLYPESGCKGKGSIFLAENAHGAWNDDNCAQDFGICGLENRVRSYSSCDYVEKVEIEKSCNSQQTALVEQNVTMATLIEQFKNLIINAIDFSKNLGTSV